MIDTAAVRKKIPGGMYCEDDLTGALDEIDRLRAQLATARARHFEEAARHLDRDDCRPHQSDGPRLAEEIRALAPMPSGMVAVPVALLKCHICGEPAACVGEYEGHGGDRPACDQCCGHGNEDGHCEPLSTALAALLEVK